MKKAILFLLVAIAFTLLISCRTSRKCVSSTDDKQNPNPTKVTLAQTEVV